MNTYNKEELESMADLITDYISERECKENLIGNDYDCVNCENIEECHMEANSHCKVLIMVVVILKKNSGNNYLIKVVISL